MILVTGSAGLVGWHISQRLERAGHRVHRFDIASSSHENIIDKAALSRALQGASGVIHLAAMTRVKLSENNPSLCWQTNVEALENHVSACLTGARPWIVFASSREVYGNADRFPVREDIPMNPLNIYARSKLAGERIISAARADGLRANICRFSNVYGCIRDHNDRVATAFARAAAFGGRVTLEGASKTFDFTHIGDVTDGLHALVSATSAGEKLPPVQFVSGRGTTLSRLAEIACAAAQLPVSVKQRPAGESDVTCFVGDPSLAEHLLGWRARTAVEDGISSLVAAFRASPMAKALGTGEISA